VSHKNLNASAPDNPKRVAIVLSNPAVSFDHDGCCGCCGTIRPTLSGLRRKNQQHRRRSTAVGIGERSERIPALSAHQSCPRRRRTGSVPASRADHRDAVRDRTHGYVRRAGNRGWGCQPGLAPRLLTWFASTACILEHPVRDSCLRLVARCGRRSTAGMAGEQPVPGDDARLGQSDDHGRFT
jgi:hypothetical protein